MKRHLFVVSLISLVAFAACALPSVNFNWSALKTGAGGWVVGLNIHPSGDPFFARTDVGGAYRFEEATSSWKQIVTTATIANYTDFIWGYPGGVLSLVSAPSNASRAYMAYANYLFRSENKGDTWTRLPLTGLSFDANADYRLQGERFAVSPVNPDIVYYGSQEGLRYSANAGNSWATVSLAGFGITGSYAVGNVLFYNQTTVYFTSDNNGVFATYNSGASWVKLNSGTGAPANAAWYDHIVTDASGALYVSEAKLYKYSQGVWKDLNVTVDPGAVAIKPDNNSIIVVLYANGGWPYVSSDAGLTWKKAPQVTRTATDIPWLAWTDEWWMSVGNIQFHPLRPNELWFSEGIGMWKTSNVLNNTFSWVSVNTKLEELVGTDIIAPPGGKPVSAHFDRAIFYHQDIDTYPSTHAPTNRFNSAWDLDYSAMNPTFVVAVVSDHRFCCTSDGLYIQSGYSTDGGKTWQRFGSLINNNHPADLWFGDIAVASNDTNSIIWLPSFNAPPYYTTNRGTTWNVITLPNLGTSSNGSHPVIYYNRRVLTADRVRDRTFYLYHTDKGVYRTTDGGTSWELRANTNLPKGSPAGAYNVVMESVPGYEGHLYWGNQLDFGFWKSTDGGDTWTKCNTTTRVNSFGFGKSATGGYPTIYAQGTADGVKGLFMSEDTCSSWKILNSTYPQGLWALIPSIAGDLNVTGRIYMNFPGQGPMYGDVVVSGASVSPTPSVTPTRTPSVSPSRSPVASSSVSPSRTPSITPSVTPSRTPSASPVSPSTTPSRTPSSSPVSPSTTPSRTPSPSTGASTSTTPTPSRTPSTTPSRTPSSSPGSPSTTPSRTPSPSTGASSSTTPSPSRTPSSSPVSPSTTPSRTPSPSTAASSSSTSSPSRTPSTSPNQAALSPSSSPSTSPSSTSSSSKSDDGVPLMVIVPAAAGGVVVVGAATAIGIFVKRRRPNGPEEFPDAEL